MKIRHKNFHGDTVETTVAGYVKRQIDSAGGHGYGQIEQLQAELNETKQFLLRVVTVLEDALDEDDVRYLCKGTRELDSYNYDDFTVISDSSKPKNQDDGS